jgi:SAM-dependent methyltransferase
MVMKSGTLPASNSPGQKGNGSLGGAGRSAAAAEETAKAARFQSISVSYFEHLKKLSIARGLWICAPLEEERRFTGWVLPPCAIDREFHIVANGQVCRREPAASIPEDAYHMFARFGLADRATQYSFDFTIPEFGDANEIQLTCPFSDHPDSIFATYYWPRTSQEATPLANMMRVARTRSFGSFVLMGYTQYRHLRALIDRYAPQAQQVLDWGCGAARIGRYFATDSRFRLTGVDVDHVNVDWCRQTYGKQGAFSLIDPCQKTPFPDGSFDMAYGISIFTHLNRDSESFWLAELRRLLRPGGLAIMTIHGELAFFKAVNDFWQYCTLIQDGFYDYGACPDLRVDGKQTISETLYRNVFHTRPYLHSVWGQYFDIVDVIPGGSTAHQDYVVMIRR